MKKNKIIILSVSSFVTILISLLAFIQANGFCYQNILCNRLWSAINLTGNILMIFIPTFLFSLITYFIREEIFRAWSKFTYVWLPLSIFLVLITPDSSGGFFVSLIDKEMVAILMSGLFCIISLIIIIVKLVKPYWNK